MRRRFVPRTRWGKAIAIIWIIVTIFAIASFAAGSNKASGASGDTSGAAVAATVSPDHSSAPAKAHRNHTITFVVYGSPADVTYGQGGSSNQGTVPMHIKQPLRGTANYDLTAVLSDGGGKVTVDILVDGKSISKASATGAFNAASADIMKNPFTGKWEDLINS